MRRIGKQEGGGGKGEGKLDAWMNHRPDHELPWVVLDWMPSVRRRRDSGAAALYGPIKAHSKQNQESK